MLQYFFTFTAQFQTMNIGTLAQPNVVTIQHQGIYKLHIANETIKNIIYSCQR